MEQVYSELLEWFSTLRLLDQTGALVFPKRTAYMSLRRGRRFRWEFRIGEEVVVAAYWKRSMRARLLAWWSGFSVSMDVNQ